LNRFLTLSSEHNTPFLKSSRRHLKAIVREQESQLKDKVAQAIELPTNKRKIKELAQKKRKIQAELKAADKSQKKNAATSPEFEKMEQETELVSLEVTDNQERARAYLAELKKRFEDNVEGAKRADEARLTRILGEATGRIGRERWEELRRGMGKLAWWKVQVSTRTGNRCERNEDFIIDHISCLVSIILRSWSRRTLSVTWILAMTSCNQFPRSRRRHKLGVPQDRDKHHCSGVLPITTGLSFRSPIPAKL
jgi:hypothetical protein